MPPSTRWQRGLTVFAIAALLLDAVLLALAGVWTERTGLLLGGAAALAASGAVWLAWLRQRRRLEEIARERAALVNTIRDLGRDLPRDP